MKLQIKKLKNKVIKYFCYFSNKDILKLDSVFSNNIQVVDWKNNVKGKNKVLNFNKKIFSKFKKIKVLLKEILYNPSKCSFACKITIKLDSKNIDVIDLIYFDSSLKIKKIEAYLK
jgi:hypothetical protein